MQGKYKILFDYGAYYGFKFYDEKDFDSIDEAIKYAVSLNFSAPFLVVTISWSYKNE